MSVRCAPLSYEAQRLQPFVFLPTGVYRLTRQHRARTVLVSPAGVRHALRELASIRTWQEHTARHARADLLRAIAADTPAHCVVADTEAAAYFLSVLVPAFEAHERGGGGDHPGAAPLAVTDALDEILRGAPAPQVPGPGLLALGRLWLLAEGQTPTGWHVRAGDTPFAPTGRAVALAALVDSWRQTIREFVAHAAARMAAQSILLAPPDADASRELATTGALERGDLVLLQTTPPRLGHVIPRHRNRTLRRRSDRDLLLTAPLARIAGGGLGDLKVFERRSSPADGWQRVDLPHGLCLGSGLSRPDGLPLHLALAVGLRWAAIRIAGNGRFHEAD